MHPYAISTDALARARRTRGQTADSAPIVAKRTALQPDSERLRARLEHKLKLTDRRNRHIRLAVTLAIEPRKAVQLVRQARCQVALWRIRSLCSELYIERWSQLLSRPPREIARAMTELGEWEDALFQNSPWAGAWN